MKIRVIDVAKLVRTNDSKYMKCWCYIVIEFSEYINPKSINLGQLFGEFRQGSYEWLDGVVSTIFRSYANDEEDDNKWVNEILILFEQVWIECNEKFS